MDTVILDGDEFHHIIRVRRLRIKDRVLLNNGNGLLAEAEISSIGKNEAMLRIVSMNQAQPRKLPFALAFALLKNKHDELLVEKCTELGASKFYPLLTDLGVRTEGKNTQSRLQRIAISAIKQCDNPFLPQVTEPHILSTSFTQIIKDGYQPVICSEFRPDTWMRHLSFNAPPCFIIGPEGGWSHTELGYFSSGGYSSITLSHLITRAETAAIAAAAQFVALFD